MEGFNLVFDNGGGITLQTEGYCHHYNDGYEVAHCISEIMSGENPEYWDGNEPEHAVTYDAEIERNGGYHWISDAELLEVVGGMDADQRRDYLENISGASEREFFSTLFELRNAHQLQQ